MDRTFYTEFLQMYKDLPALWRVKSKEYGNRNLKTECYMKLINKLKEIYPDADKAMVANKINHFRFSYRRELKRLRKFSEMGQVCKPTLWYFDYLRFLNEDDGLKTKSTDKIEHTQEKNQESREVLLEPQMASNCVMVPEHSKDFKNSEKECLVTNPSKRRKLEHHYHKTTKSPSFAELQESKGDVEILAKSWAIQYNLMEDDQKLIARKLIPDILFYGSMGCLEMSHAIGLQEMFIKESSSHFSQHSNEHQQSIIESNSSFSFADQEVSNYDSISEWHIEFNSSIPPMSPTTNGSTK